MRYTSCLDLERQARLAVLSSEKRRDDISRQTIIIVELPSDTTFKWLFFSPKINNLVCVSHQ